MTRRKATMIGTLFASAVDVDLPVDNSPFWGKFFKMKVLVSTANSLSAGFLSKSQDDSASWVSFKYVNLVDYCYYCARMGHVEKECPFLSEDKMKGTVRTVPIPGIYELRASKSSVKLLTVRGGRHQEFGKHGRKTLGRRRVTSTNSQSKWKLWTVRVQKSMAALMGVLSVKRCFQIWCLGESRIRSMRGWRVARCCLPILNLPRPYRHLKPHPPGSSKKRLAQPRHCSAKKLKPSLQGPDPLEQGTTQTPLTSLFNSGPGALLTPTPPPSNRLSLKKQARLRASASPVSFPSNERNLEIEPNASHI
ncbi:hypothetical protein Tsubulata_020639 [Turnera subulata]|uniref:CCHC-type domain-containing protein n=1 Tax=Turnera subulata TaxID=218843 RepID=A0A9Q0JBY0_9ROSI|nr:hypothetical protein Tsubulata_020639 [Turnera subulata]